VVFTIRAERPQTIKVAYNLINEADIIPSNINLYKNIWLSAHNLMWRQRNHILIFDRGIFLPVM
jgi:hypothetical protein